MPSDIFRIIYCSRNAIEPDDRDRSITQILAAARRNNAEVGLTGALLYNEGTFVQALEGDFEAVQSTFERILGDPRHQEIVVLQAETVGAPIFTEWTMAFAEPEDKQAAKSLLSQAMAHPGDRVAAQVLDLLDRVVRHEAEPIF